VKRALRGFTLVELLVAVAVLAFITMLLYGAFAGMKRSRDGLTRTQGRYREGRLALSRFVRDKTGFVGTVANPADRLDFNAFSNIRRDRNSHVTDQLEVSYFGGDSIEEPGTTDLLRRSSAYLDEEPIQGGRVDVVATDIDLFDLSYLDPTTSLWVDSWDTTQAAGQPNRLPLQVRVTLVLNGGRRSASDRGRDKLRFATTVMLPIHQPLSFAIQ
jgi:general secretion pathway protein J